MEHNRNRYWVLFLFVLVLSPLLLVGRAAAQEPNFVITYDPLPPGWERWRGYDDYESIESIAVNIGSDGIAVDKGSISQSVWALLHERRIMVK